MASSRPSSWSMVLLLGLLLPFLGSSAWLYWHRQQVKQTVKAHLMQGVEPAELVHFAFTPDQLNELRWEHEREFVYQEQWFDVVRTATHGDTVHLWCWLDHAETALERQLHALVDRALGRDTQPQEQQARLFRFAQTLFTPPSQLPPLLFCFSPDQTTLFHYNLGHSRYLGPPPLPPPRNVWA